MHGISQGCITGISGGDLGQGFLSGMVSSAVSSIAGGLNAAVKLKGIASDISTMLFGSASGGLSSKLMGGNFWQGAATGLTVSALNHTMHKIQEVRFLTKLEKELENNNHQMDGSVPLKNRAQYALEIMKRLEDGKNFLYFKV